MCMGLIAGAVGVGVDALASSRGAKAANAAAEYNARASDYNASIASQQAEQAGYRGQRSEQSLRRGARQLRGAQRSALAGAGVLVDAGSGAEAGLDLERGVEFDAMDIRYNTALEQWGFQSQASEFRGQAAMQRASKVSPRRAGLTTLLSGASSLGSQFFLSSGSSWNPFKRAPRAPSSFVPFGKKTTATAKKKKDK